MSASPVTTPGFTVAGSVAVAALREVAGRAAELGLVNALALAQSARIESLTIVVTTWTGFTWAAANAPVGLQFGAVPAPGPPRRRGVGVRSTSACSAATPPTRSRISLCIGDEDDFGLRCKYK